MLRTLTLVAALLLPLAAQATCTGQNLIDALPLAEQTALRDAARAVPFPDGNLWHATRGAESVHIIGTYHFPDPRHDSTLATAAPWLAAASLLLVEAGPIEEAALHERMARDPGVMTITKGPTLPELLPEAEWQALSTAMQARGIPGLMAAKFQPWFLTMMLGIPPCDMERIAREPGLDQRLVNEATASGLPVQALESYDTLFTLFDALEQQDQLAMVRAALAMEPQVAELSVTLGDAYFDGESRLIWEFTRHLMLSAPGADRAQALRDLALMETALMTNRNRAWIPVIEAAAAKGPVVAAFGALHLSGEDGVLNLLVRKGFTLERRPL